MENQEQMTTNQNQSVVSIGDWVITLILTGIPLVNLIMLLIWAFSSSTPVSKSNWAKAILILMAIGLILAIVFWGTLASIFIGSGM